MCQDCYDYAQNQELVNLISEILKIDPAERLNAKGVLSHVYAKNAIDHNKRRYKVEIYSRILGGEMSKEDLAEIWNLKH